MAGTLVARLPIAALEKAIVERKPPPELNLLVQKNLLVGARRFELLTPCAQGRCATRLRYAPT